MLLGYPFPIPAADMFLHPNRHQRHKVKKDKTHGGFHCAIQAASIASAPKGSHTESQQLCFEWTCIKSWVAALPTQHQSCREGSAESLRGVSEGAHL